MIHPLFNLAEPSYFDQKDYESEAIRPKLKESTSKISFKESSDVEFELPISSFFANYITPSVEFSAESVDFILRYFIEMNCKEAMASILYLERVLLQSCNEGFISRIESFILRLLERFTDFDLRIRTTIMSIAVKLVSHYNSNEVTMQLIQTIRKSISSSHCNSKPELAAVFNMLLSCNISDQGPSQSSIVSLTDKHNGILIMESICSLLLGGSVLQRNSIITLLYDEIVLKGAYLSHFGQLFVGKLFKCEDIANIKLWALKYIYNMASIEDYEAALLHKNQDSFLVLGELLNFLEQNKQRQEIEKLTTRCLIQCLETGETALDSNNMVSVNTNIGIIDERVIALNENSDSSSGGFKIACLLLRIGNRKNLLTSMIKYFLKCSKTAATGDIIEFLSLSVSQKVEIEPFLDDLLELQIEVKTSEDLKQPLFSWTVENLNRGNARLLQVFQKYEINYTEAIALVINGKGVHQYLAPYIPIELGQIYITKLESVSFEDFYSLKYLVKMLLNIGNESLWAKFTCVCAKDLELVSNAILVLSIFNDEMNNANLKSLTSGLVFIQRLLKAASHSKTKGRKAKKILETTIQNLKILSTRMNTITSFHIGNLKSKRARVEDS